MRGIRRPALALEAPSPSIFISPTCHSKTTFAGRSSQTDKKIKESPKEIVEGFGVLPQTEGRASEKGCCSKGRSERRVNRRHPQRPNGGSPAAGRDVWARSAFSMRLSDGTRFSERHSRSINLSTNADRHSPHRSSARRDAVDARKTAGLTATRVQSLGRRRGFLRSKALTESNRRRRGAPSSLFEQCVRGKEQNVGWRMF